MGRHAIVTSMTSSQDFQVFLAANISVNRDEGNRSLAGTQGYVGVQSLTACMKFLTDIL